MVRAWPQPVNFDAPPDPNILALLPRKPQNLVVSCGFLLSCAAREASVSITFTGHRMFKLDRLELRGFKSFVDPVTLDFSGGMTGIVGPNGCGKSNVCDAVCWVLGERSAKSLRGSKMEDVIFAGSESRKPLGLAEVELSLTTESSFEHAQDGQLTIGRRVHRSGESQYFLNGKTVRLKDIRDLLMDTGLGLRAYSVIEQGKIGMILSGKPQERRQLLEEAAGVTRYKERRRIAEIKLEEARGNLSRLDDILAEVEKRLRSLKRQAGAARRFKKRKKRYDELLSQVLLGRWSRFSSRQKDLEARIAQRVEREAGLEAGLQKTEAALAEERETLDVLARELAGEHRREAELAAKIEGKQEFIKGSRERVHELRDRLTAGAALGGSRQERLAELRQALEAMGEDSRALAGERDSMASGVSEHERQIDVVERRVADAESRLESLRGRLLASMGSLNGLRNRLHQEQVEREKGDLRKKHLAEELAEKLRERQEVARRLEEATTRHSALERQSRSQQGELDQLSSRLEELDTRRVAVDEERAELTSRLAAAGQRRDLLLGLEEAQAERRQRTQEIFREAGLGDPDFLSDRVRVPPGWEHSLDLYLGRLADAVVLSPGDDALDLAGRLAAAGADGRLLEVGDGDEPRHIQDPAVHSFLPEALGLPQELVRALPPAYLVETRADARRLARRYPGVAFVSRERMWAQAGTLHVRSEHAQPGSLLLSRELTELQQKIPPLEGRLAELESKKDELSAKIADGEETKCAAEAELAELHRELAVAEARREDLEARERRYSIEHHTVHSEQGELESALALVAERTEQLEQELGRQKKLHEDLEAQFDRSQAGVEEARAERESVRTSEVSHRGRLDLLKERLESHHRERARLEREIAEGDEFLAGWELERGRLGQRESEVEAAIVEAEGNLQRSLEERSAAQEDVLGRQEKLDVKRSELRELETRIEMQREERDGVRAETAELRVEEAALKQDIEHLDEQYREHFDNSLPEAPEEAPPELAEREADLQRLKDQIDRTGPVNLLAAEEFSEQEERHKFLAEQRGDVAASVESLRQTIREINATSSERFLKTFLETNESFGRIYSQLFRGGQAEMRLLDEDDPLESGIEIVARPPGKKLQNIMLLSGGEKALTAIALLFALFRTKPSPFCILDEVDAPLDDVNTLRFVEILKQMSHETQFVVITHNKLTMEASTRLYGVTMQERGVSALVSVELDDIQPAAEPALAAAG